MSDFAMKKNKNHKVLLLSRCRSLLQAAAKSCGLHYPEPSFSPSLRCTSLLTIFTTLSWPTHSITLESGSLFLGCSLSVSSHAMLTLLGSVITILISIISRPKEGASARSPPLPPQCDMSSFLYPLIKQFLPMLLSLFCFLCSKSTAIIMEHVAYFVPAVQRS